MPAIVFAQLSESQREVGINIISRALDSICLQIANSLFPLDSLQLIGLSIGIRDESVSRSCELIPILSQRHFFN